MVAWRWLVFVFVVAHNQRVDRNELHVGRCPFLLVANQWSDAERKVLCWPSAFATLLLCCCTNLHDQKMLESVPHRICPSKIPASSIILYMDLPHSTCFQSRLNSNREDPSSTFERLRVLSSMSASLELPVCHDMTTSLRRRASTTVNKLYSYRV